MKNGIVKSKAVTPTTVADKTIMIFQHPELYFFSSIQKYCFFSIWRKGAWGFVLDLQSNALCPYSWLFFLLGRLEKSSENSKENNHI